GFLEGDFTCGLKKDGTLRCWGSASNGHFGNGTPVFQTSPKKIGTDAWLHIAAAAGVTGASTCGVTKAGELSCWGSPLGVGVLTQTPTTVGTDTSWANVAVGSGYACPRRVDGSLYCWGEPIKGVVGAGFTVPQATGLTASAVGLGGASCAVSTSSKLYC